MGTRTMYTETGGLSVAMLPLISATADEWRDALREEIEAHKVTLSENRHLAAMLDKANTERRKAEAIVRALYSVQAEPL